MTSEGNSAYIDDLLDFNRIETDSSDPNVKSEVAEFFANTNILITGGTGFLGKLLIEKLLRSCPDLSKIYMIVRPKKGKNAVERFTENFDCIVYDRLRREQPDFLNKVIMLEGDAAQEDYGLTPESKKMLMNINIILHAAADVRFDEKIRTASNTNVRGAKFLLTFARQLPNLKAFVHVSTAFSQCVHEVIEEEHYRDTIDCDKFMTLVDILDDEKLEKISPALLGKWPNTYVLSKALAENVVLKYGDDLPVCIVRPSIVISTFKEPIEAWTNNLYGATGIVMGCAVGFIHTLYCIPENAAELIPADYVVSSIICAAWDTYNRKVARDSDPNLNAPEEERMPIYNCVSSYQNPISWKEFMHEIEYNGIHIPPMRTVWCYSLTLNRYLFVHTVMAFFLHTVPAIIADAIAYVRGHEPMCYKTYKKVSKFSAVLTYFTIREWKFHNENVTKLWAKMNCTDKKNFCFNVATLDWKEYFTNHVKGLRLYLLNDPFDTLPESRKKYQRLLIAHYSILTVGVILVIWLILAFLSSFRNLWTFAH